MVLHTLEGFSMEKNTVMENICGKMAHLIRAIGSIIIWRAPVNTFGQMVAITKELGSLISFTAMAHTSGQTVVSILVTT